MHVSVVIPAFNAAPFIGQALASVLAQSHPAWTIYAVDDGSTDDTAAVIRSFGDPRIHLICQPNQGVSAARNRGLARACGEAVLFLDADDALAPDALARLARRLGAAPDAVAASGRFRFAPAGLGAYAGIPLAGIRARGAECIARMRALCTPRRGDLLPGVLERNPFANGGHILIRRAAAAAAGGFQPGIAYGEDWVFWTRLAQLGRFVALRRGGPVLAVRQHDGGAYRSMASNPASFQPCMAAIFADPGLAARFGRARLDRIRRRADAENAWIVGRELVRHGRTLEGRAWLRRSVAAKPGVRRALLLAAAHASPLLPRAARGPFQPYATSPG